MTDCIAFNFTQLPQMSLRVTRLGIIHIGAHVCVQERIFFDVRRQVIVNIVFGEYADVVQDAAGNQEFRSSVDLMEVQTTQLPESPFEQFESAVHKLSRCGQFVVEKSLRLTQLIGFFIRSYQPLRQRVGFVANNVKVPHADFGKLLVDEGQVVDLGIVHFARSTGEDVEECSVAVGNALKSNRDLLLVIEV